MNLRNFLNLYILAALYGAAGLWTVAAASERNAINYSLTSPPSNPTTSTPRKAGAAFTQKETKGFESLHGDSANVSAGATLERDPGFASCSRTAPAPLGTLVGRREIEARRGDSLQGVRSVPAPAEHSSTSFERTGQGSSLRVLAVAIAAEERVDVPVFLALIGDESSWDQFAEGKHGEQGLLQLKAPTATWCGIKDRFEAEPNMRCGARYLRAQFDTFGSWQMAVVAFKAGPGSIPDNIPAHSWAYAQRTLRKAEALR